MEHKRSYVVSFGDSTRYKVYFDGTKEAFEASEAYKEIKDKVYSYLKEKFPTGGYEDVIRAGVADDDGRDYQVLDASNMNSLLESVSRQVEVKRETGELNDNAPFDKH